MGDTGWASEWAEGVAVSVGLPWLACMPSRRAVGLVASVLVGAVVVLGGCTPGGGSTPVGTSSGTTSATSIASQTTTPAGTTGTATGSWTAQPYPSDVPEAARQHTDAGAEAFVRHYWASLNTAWTQPRAGLLAALCLPTSKACAALEETATKLVTDRQRYVGEPLTVSSVTALATRDGLTPVDVQGRQERRDVIDAQGRVVLTDQQKAVHFVVELLWGDSHWIVSEMKVVVTQ